LHNTTHRKAHGFAVGFFAARRGKRFGFIQSALKSMAFTQNFMEGSEKYRSVPKNTIFAKAYGI
jgi:hypothetical protein